jgi:hypothetical protein
VKNFAKSPYLIIFAIPILIIMTMLISITPNVFAEVDYAELNFDSKSTLQFEGKETNVIVTTIQFTNNANEELSSYSNYFYLVSNGQYYDSVSGSVNDIVGSKVCPSISDIPAGASKEITLCYETPKNLSDSSYSLELLNHSKSYCDSALTSDYTAECQKVTNPIIKPQKTDYNEYKKKFITKNTDIELKLNSAGIIQEKEVSLLKIDFDVTNISSNEVSYSSSDVLAITPDGIEYSPYQSFFGNCPYTSIELNPKLTKSYSFCFEIPDTYRIFDLVIRDTNYSTSCDSSYSECTEALLSISVPQAEKTVISKQTEPTKYVPEPQPETKSESKKLGVAQFVDPNKNPQSYVDRYNNEPTYKKWFDDNYPEYSSIYEAVGLEEPTPEPISEPTPEPISEPTPKVESEQVPKCGAGTELVNGECQIIKSEVVDTPKQGGGCLIATATYGSEMASQVQQLRELRDNSLLHTKSGTSFMNTFNDFYYSFSPAIADYERENPVFKEAVKITLAPLISSLSLLNYVDMDSESEVLGYGISLIVLNLGMYFVAPAIIISKVKKFRER